MAATSTLRMTFSGLNKVQMEKLEEVVRANLPRGATLVKVDLKAPLQVPGLPAHELRKILNEPLESLGFKPRLLIPLTFAIRHAGGAAMVARKQLYIGDLVQLGRKALLNSGRLRGAAVDRLEEVLAIKGLSLGMEVAWDVPVPKEGGVPFPKQLAVRLDKLGLNVRTMNTLINEGKTFARDVVYMTEMEVLRFRGFGPDSLANLEEGLATVGLTLSMRRPTRRKRRQPS